MFKCFDPDSKAVTNIMDQDQTDNYTFRPIAEEPNLAQAAMSPSHRPKLYNCWRRSEEIWSSTGSRHSSRPGSSTASSSRPPSQPNVPPNAATATGSSSLYCKSNNSSLSDVSVARNFQQLSVSSRRALFKTQKWSHSFEQQQMSPGKRRQVNKSLDLDSGYSGSLATDIIQVNFDLFFVYGKSRQFPIFSIWLRHFNEFLFKYPRSSKLKEKSRQIPI